MSKDKRCCRCGVPKAAEAFYPHRTHSDGLSSACRDCTKSYNAARYEAVHSKDPASIERRRRRSLEWYRANLDRSRERVSRTHRAQREACIAAYGGRCICCGEDRYEFLAIDHPDGGGNQHRAAVGSKFSRWLAHNGFPPGYRVLCHNCNSSFGYYGYCPHEVAARAI